MIVAPSVEVQIWLFTGNKLRNLDVADQVWEAVSGPHGKGALPPGRYVIGDPTAIDPDSSAPYRDPTGNAWWAPLSPQFQMNPMRPGLGIHPDGGVPGTLGCVGIKGQDTTPLVAALKQCPLRLLYVV